MPKVKLESVVSFSSEDPIHVASNILLSDPSKKWKCKKAGESSATVVVQLEKATVISSMDIGNEHSAYIEIQVGRSTSDEFKDLLVMSEFMTTLECRKSQNINKVRMFSTDQLSKLEREQKWDRIKIICTQPFNFHAQYGISFITLYSNDGSSSSGAPKNIGKFTLRPESPDDLSVGSLFARRKELSNNTPLKGAAAIREASNNPSPCQKRKLPQKQSNTTNVDYVASPRDKNRNDILYTDADDEVNDKIDKLIEKKKKEDDEKKAKEDEEKKAKEAKRTPKVKKQKTETVQERTPKLKIEIKTPVSSTTKPKTQTLIEPSTSTIAKRKLDLKNTPNKKPKLNTKPFNELLSNVSFVISGIQNPERANIRTMALSMGAKYKPDWNSTCTHLICAFRNTPKFNQVKGQGKIITKKWIHECHSQRKKLPWRRYALDPSDQNQSESEEEIGETTDAPKDDATEISNIGSDTDDEIERIQTLQNGNQNNAKATDTTNLMESNDTDNEAEEIEPVDEQLPALGNYFVDKQFFIDNNLDMEEKRRLKKYIVAYNGNISESIDVVDYVITTPENVVELLDGSHKSFICPDWVWECHNKQRLVALDDFVMS